MSWDGAVSLDVKSMGNLKTVPFKLLISAKAIYRVVWGSCPGTKDRPELQPLGQFELRLKCNIGKCTYNVGIEGPISHSRPF